MNRSSVVVFLTSLVFVLLSGCVTRSQSAEAGTPAASRIAYLNAAGGLPTGLPFSEAVRVDGLLFLSGQIGTLPGEPRLVAGGIGPETRQVMQNIERVLQTNGYSMEHIVKCTVMLADMQEWPAFNSVYRTFFPKHFPARSAFGATGLAYDARVEIECIAAR